MNDSSVAFRYNMKISKLARIQWFSLRYFVSFYLSNQIVHHKQTRNKHNTNLSCYLVIFQINNVKTVTITTE